MPRAKFVQTMLVNVLVTCIAAACSLLITYSSVQARNHTSAPISADSSTSAVGKKLTDVPYNSSASAVCGVWLFFFTWLLNAMRASFPQFTLPTILGSIFISVAGTYGPFFPTVSAGETFVEKLLESFLSGFAIATGVALLVLPMTSRRVFFAQMGGYIGLIRLTMKSHSAYFHSLETDDMFWDEETQGKYQKKRKDDDPRAFVTLQPHNAEAMKLKGLANKISQLHGKVYADLQFTKRELAFGHLGPDDVSQLFNLVRNIMLPVIGLTTVADIFSRLGSPAAWAHGMNLEGRSMPKEEERMTIVNEWHEIMKMANGSFDDIINVMDEGMEHALLVLRLKKSPKKKRKGKDSREEEDLEDKGTARPGEKGFSDYLERKSWEFFQGKKFVLREWCARRGIDLPEDFFEHPATSPIIQENSKYFNDSHWRYHVQRQLYMLLYFEYILFSISRAVHALAKFADDTEESGKFKKRHLIVPGYRRTKKWFINSFKREDPTDDNTLGDGLADQTLFMGQAYRERKDPEHLPPRTTFEKFGNSVRTATNSLRSPESTFGFRVACATMTIAIIGYLRDTQVWFVEQRLLWSLIMVAISMSPTSGQAVFNFVLRVLGTCLATAATFVIYYIVDGHTAGIIVFLWLWVSMGMWVLLKRPNFIALGMISTITSTLIIGYTLEVSKLGKTVAESNGQPAYPIYLLAPYRLATVVGGLTVAFIWTFVPYPITEHSVLRQSLGKSLYLLANFYSIVHETVQARIRGDQGDMDDKNSPGRRMEKVRNKVFGKQMAMLAGLRTYSKFTRWEMPIGGKFPKEQYDAIIQGIQK
jgi:hypothetical protein